MSSHIKVYGLAHTKSDLSSIDNETYNDEGIEYVIPHQNLG